MVWTQSGPNWLQRLLASLLEKNNTGAKPSELLRRVSAEGELTADSVTIEKVKLGKVKANLEFHDLHLDVNGAEAQWAGGTVQGGMQAVFSASPSYSVSAAFDGVNLALLPWGGALDRTMVGHGEGDASVDHQGRGPG